MRIQRNKKGVSLIETVMGAVLFIMIVLFFVDVGAVVLAQTNNDRMARNAARAAAEEDNGQSAQKAVDELIKSTPTSLMFSDPKTTKFDFDTNSGFVTVETTVVCNLPVPVPLMQGSSVELNARGAETIVGILAN